jgi:hypothetical protein
MLALMLWPFSLAIQPLTKEQQYPRTGEDWWEVHRNALVNPWGQQIKLYDSDQNSIIFTLTSQDKLDLPGLSVYRVNYHITFEPYGARIHVPDWTTKFVIPYWIDSKTLRVTFQSPVTVRGGQEIGIELPEAVSFENCENEEYEMFNNVHICFSEKMGTHKYGPKIVPKPQN